MIEHLSRHAKAAAQWIDDNPVAVRCILVDRGINTGLAGRLISSSSAKKRRYSAMIGWDISAERRTGLSEAIADKRH